MNDPAHMKQVVEKYIKAISTEDMDAIRSIYADNGTVEDPVGSPQHEGIDNIMSFYGAIKGMGVKLELTGAVRLAGNSAAFPFQAKIGPITMEVIDVFEFNEDGKVVSMRAYWGPENRY
jgi:steroid delta-isomerase